MDIIVINNELLLITKQKNHTKFNPNSEKDVSTFQIHTVKDIWKLECID